MTEGEVATAVSEAEVSTVRGTPVSSDISSLVSSRSFHPHRQPVVDPHHQSVDRAGYKQTSMYSMDPTAASAPSQGGDTPQAGGPQSVTIRGGGRDPTCCSVFCAPCGICFGDCQA